MPFDPLLILLFGLLAVMIFFTWRNGRKRKAEAEEMQTKLVPGAEVMTQHGIYGELISIDDEKNEAIIETTPGTRLRVHRQTIARVVEPQEFFPGADDEVDADAVELDDDAIAADDVVVDDSVEPEFGERAPKKRKKSGDTPADAAE